MNKENQLIMVVKREDLFRGDYHFQGFLPDKNISFETRILASYGYMTRKFAESDPNYKQPIAYSLIVNPTIQNVFSYQRSQDKEKYHEKRLQGKWSLGVGGHIERKDSYKKRENPILKSMVREVREEVRISKDIDIGILGYINDDSNDVGKVHFGIVYVVLTDAKNVAPKDPEINEGKLRSLGEIETLFSSPDYDVETWSKIVFDPLKEFLQNYKN